MRDVLHDIAHELRQPLSAIESIAYYLALVLPRDDEKLQDQLVQLQRLVEQSDWILSNGLHLADPLPLSLEAIDFEKLLMEVLAKQGWPQNRSPRLEFAGSLPLVQLDPALGRALIGNLLMLFRQLATESHPAVLRTVAVEPPKTGEGKPPEGVPGNREDPHEIVALSQVLRQAPGVVALEMETAAPGYGSEAALGPGANLSLGSARKIAAAHGGSLECTVDPMAGIRVRVMLP